MEKELEKLEKLNEEIINSNLCDETKKIVLELVRSRIFELRVSIDQINKNIEFVQETKNR